MSQRPDLVFAHPTRSRFVLLRVAAQCLLAACCLFGLPGAALAGAQDYILDKAYWTDTTGTASFEQARASGALVIGSPQTVKEIFKAQAQRCGHNYLVLLIAFGSLTHEQQMRSLELFRSEVIPELAAMNEAA